MKPTLWLRYGLVMFLIGFGVSLKLPLWGSCLGLFFGGLGVWFWPSKTLLGVLFIFVGASYVSVYNTLFYRSHLETLVGESVEVQAQVIGESRLSRSGVQTVRLKVKAVQQSDGSWQQSKGFLLWNHAPKPMFKAGTVVVLEGTITQLVSFSADFDATAYWARWGVSHSLNRVTVIDRSSDHVPTSIQWRNGAQGRIKHHLQKPHSTIALGMLMGLKEKLPPALEADFKASGLQHLLVVSGTNVTLLLFAIGLVLRPLSPWFKYSLGLLVLLFYLGLVGFDPPALRATLFGALVGFAATSGFNIEYRNLLLFGATLMGLFDPRFITHDVSFWLSFGATAGIFLGVPMLDQWLKFIKPKYLRLLIAASVAAQVSVFPILIIMFGSFPYGGLLSNLFTEPLVPTIMFLGAGGIIIGDLPLLGLEALWSGGLSLSISALIAVAQITATLPIISVPIWIGYILLGILGGLAGWALFSDYYQTRYWEPFEENIKN